MKALFQYIRIIFLLIFTTILLTACEREIEIPLPDHEAKLVSNCIAVSGEPFRVIVARSFGMDEQVQQADIYLTDAQVDLWKDGEQIETLTYIPYDGPREFGYYSAHLPEPGSRYELRISHPDFPDMRQEMVMPPLPTIDNIEFIPDAAIGESGYPLQYVRATLTDAPDTHNYYSLRALYQTVALDSPQVTAGLISQLEAQGTGIENLSRFGLYILSDETFDGRTVSLTFEEEQIGQSSLTPDNYEPQYVVLWWRSWNEPAYRLGVEYYPHENSRRFIDFDLSVLTKSPLPIYSNAEGGFGVFGGYTVRTDTLFF